MGCLPSKERCDEYKKVSESIDEMIRQSKKDYRYALPLVLLIRGLFDQVLRKHSDEKLEADST